MELGIVIELREKQFSKALSPMLVTLLGMVIEVREEHQEKAEFPIPVTLLDNFHHYHESLNLYSFH